MIELLISKLKYEPVEMFYVRRVQCLDSFNWPHLVYLTKNKSMFEEMNKSLDK